MLPASPCDRSGTSGSRPASGLFSVRSCRVRSLGVCSCWRLAAGGCQLFSPADPFVDARHAARIGDAHEIDDRLAVVETPGNIAELRVRVADDNRAGMLENLDRKSTRLNSSHLGISYAVFCLKKKTEQ